MTVKWDFNVKGESVQLSGSADEVVEAALKLASRADEFTEAVTGIKQAVLANGVFTGVDPALNVPASVPNTGSSFVESGPPGDDVPSCKHGKMTDLRGQTNAKGEPYKNNFYCTLKTDNYRDKCKPVS